MVGIPGKSKGCATCRRRKIRCDLQEPDCQRCIKSGRTCEGYARYPTFLNQTLKGPVRRGLLEEAKPRQISGSTAPQLISNPVTSRLDVEFRLPRQVSNIKVSDKQLIALFHQKYYPLDFSDSPCKWFGFAISFIDPGEALELAVKAIAMTRVAYLYGDTVLAMRGRTCYGHALRKCQNALWDERLMWSEQTLALLYALSLYELFEATCNGISGWSGHISGMSHLVQMRGPQRHRSKLEREILEDFRLSQMIQSVQMRKKSFFSSPEWNPGPWTLETKDSHQRLYDKGFDLAALIQDVDEAHLEVGNASIITVTQYLLRGSTLNAEMDAWYHRLLEESPSPLYWLENSNHKISDFPPAPVNFSRFEFPNYRLADATCIYWALKQVLSYIIWTLGEPLVSFMDSQASIVDPEAANLIKQILDQNDPDKCRDLAKSITCATPYCISDRMGLLGASRSLFPLRVALFTLQRYGNSPELMWCLSLYNTISQKKGVGYAREIEQLEGGYGRHGDSPY